jgi:hypothetical protein
MALLCYVRFLRNALDCLRELRRIYDRRDIQEAHRDLAAAISGSPFAPPTAQPE